MTDWKRIIDRGIAIRAGDNDPFAIEPEECCSRLAATLDPDEPDPQKLKLMNLCFDALMCIRELEARGRGPEKHDT